MASEQRTCAYCGEIKCKHSYRYARSFAGHKRGTSVSCQNISAQSTLGEMKESMKEWLNGPDDTPCVWSWAFTKRGPNKVTRTLEGK